jgi:hypothetical protein
MSVFAMSPLSSILLQTSADVANQFNGYLILGYLVMWIIALVYIVSLATRQRNLMQDIQLLKRLLQDDEKSSE